MYAVKPMQATRCAGQRLAAWQSLHTARSCPEKDTLPALHAEAPGPDDAQGANGVYTLCVYNRHELLDAEPISG